MAKPKYWTTATFASRPMKEKVNHLLVALEEGVVGVEPKDLIPYYIERSRIFLGAYLEEKRLTEKVVKDKDLDNQVEEDDNES